MTTIITLKKKSGGDEVWKDPPVAKNKFCRGVSCQLLMELIENVKGGGKLSSHLAFFQKNQLPHPLKIRRSCKESGICEMRISEENVDDKDPQIRGERILEKQEVYPLTQQGAKRGS